MKEELYEILDERAKLKVAGFPLAFGLSLGLHVTVISIFLWGAGAGSPSPQGQPLKQAEPIAASVTNEDGRDATETQGAAGHGQ